jgi:hypothetical protein
MTPQRPARALPQPPRDFEPAKQPCKHTNTCWLMYIDSSIMLPTVAWDEARDDCGAHLGSHRPMGDQ